MRTLRLSHPRRVLVVAPHSDDETIAAFGLLRRLVARGSRVRVLIVTDGAASHHPTPSWPTRRLVAERHRETRRAMRRVGLGAGAIRFAGLPDGRLDPAHHARPFARALARCGPADLLVAPIANDAHEDHRATAALLARAHRAARRLGYQVWPRAGMRRGRVVILPLGPARAIKRGAIACYRTQTGAAGDDPDAFRITTRLRQRFCGPAELFSEGGR